MRGNKGGIGGMPRFRGGGRSFSGGNPHNQGMNHHRPPPFNNRFIRNGPPPPRFRQPPPGQQSNWATDVINGEPEVFAETRSENGRFYYYNTRTRETMWERPQGPGVRIIRHDEVNSFNNGPPGGPMRPPPRQMNSGGPRGMMDGPRGMMFDGMGPPPRGNNNEMMSHSNGHNNMRAPFSAPPPGGFNKGENEKEFENSYGKPPLNHFPRMLPPRSPDAVSQIKNNPPPMSYGGLEPSPFPVGAPPPNFMPGAPPPFSLPTSLNPFHPPAPMLLNKGGSGGGGGGGGWGFVPGMVPPPGVPPPLLVDMSKLEPGLVLAADEWAEHTSPEGKKYFYSKKTGISTWEKPKALVDLDNAKIQLQQKSINDVAQQQMSQQIKPEPQSALTTIAQTDKEEAKPKAKKAADSKKAETCRPVSSTQISGTPWCVVWTSDRRVFFYNPSNKQSVWEKPPELVGRPDVDDVLKAFPEKAAAKQAAALKRSQGGTTDSSGSPTKGSISTTISSTTTISTPTTTTITSANSSSEPQAPGTGALEDLEQPPTKKLKSEGSSGVEKRGNQIEINLSHSKKESGGGAKPEVIEILDDDESGKSREVTALEAEARAAVLRATVPLETRLKQYRQMLDEADISAFSTWEKELHKIVFDQRYLLLTSNERKKAFDRYVEEIVEEEKRDRIERLKNVKLTFFAFLKEINLSSKANYSDFSSKYGRDERFKCVEKSRDREQFFHEYIYDLKKKEKEERTVKKKQERLDYLELLTDKIKDYHMSWSEAKKKLESDSRYHIIDSEDREDIFREFLKQLRHKQRNSEKQKRKEKEEKKSSSSDKKDEKSRKSSGGEKEKAFQLEKDGVKPHNSEDDEGVIGEEMSEEDEKGGGVDREKLERAQVSIREREKQVQKSLAFHLRDREKEREHHRHDEATQDLQALLSDLVRNVDAEWKSVKKIIKKDKRWESISYLSTEEMETIFRTHTEQIDLKKKQRFKELLSENHVNSDTRWKDLLPKIKDDPRYTKFSSSERKCYREFQLFLEEMTASMKVDFRDLLKETKFLNYKSYSTLKNSSSYMKEIESHLVHDKRYLQLNHAPKEREKLLMDYLYDLESRGPPPPPTASEPSRRK